MAVAEVDRAQNLRSGVRLEYLSLTYNVIEAGVGLAAGLAAGSVALIGFGLDSVVESSSAGILIWRLRSEGAGRRTTEELEMRAIRLVAIAFFALAAYVAVEAVFTLLDRARPEDSPVGIAIAAASLVVMPLLARAKRRAAKALDSRSMQADSRQTSLCTYLSAVLLGGLIANAAFGWWWADPIAAIGIAAIAADEGRELWRTKDLCCD